MFKPSSAIKCTTHICLCFDYTVFKFNIFTFQTFHWRICDGTLTHSLSLVRVLYIFSINLFQCCILLCRLFSKWSYFPVKKPVDQFKIKPFFGPMNIKMRKKHEHWRQVTSVCGKINQHHQDQGKNKVNEILTLFHNALWLRTLNAFVRCSSKACTVHGNPRIWVAY